MFDNSAPAVYTVLAAEDNSGLAEHIGAVASYSVLAVQTAAVAAENNSVLAEYTAAVVVENNPVLADTVLTPYLPVCFRQGTRISGTRWHCLKPPNRI